MKSMWRVFFAIFLLFGLLAVTLPGKPTRANDPVVFTDTHYDFQFGESFDFYLSFETTSSPQTVWLFLQPFAQERMVFEIPVTSEDKQIQAHAELHNLALKAFSEITYWFRVDFEDGRQISNEAVTFTYADNRFVWQTAATDHFRLHWYAGDVKFATQAMNIAETSLTKIAEQFSETLVFPVDIYIYADSNSLQQALQREDNTWMAGLTNPEWNTILVSIPRGVDQQIEMERQLPHELTHLFEYQIAGNSYSNQPIWLLEGLATNAEAVQNEVYQQVLKDALDSDSLISFSDLNRSFPSDDEALYLAYAQSASFTNYLQMNFGSDQLEELLREYATGVGVEQGFSAVYPKTLLQTEADWHQSLTGESPSLAGFLELVPYLLVLVMIAGVPLLFSLFLRLRPAKQLRKR